MNFRPVVEFSAKHYAGTMGRLWYPFIAASASLLILGIIVAVRLLPYWQELNQLIAGLLLGTLASIVLYAVMRAIAERPKQ